MRLAALSISSDSSVSSTSSSREGKRFVSPRKSVMSTASNSPSLPFYPTFSLDEGDKEQRKASKLRIHKLALLSIYARTFFSASISLCVISYLILHTFVWCNRDSRYGPAFDLVDQSHLPEEPTALIVHDDNGDRKWTVWIPPELGFPLRPWQYSEICAQAAHFTRELSSPAWFGGSSQSYYTKDSNFVDIQDAITTGLLPRPAEHIVGSHNTDKKVCQHSLTFVTETNDAGMGNTLLALWSSYGLAQKESRAFFIDDSDWVYGNYSSYFQPPPVPSCVRPPANQILPCPRNANHLVVSQATFPHIFGSAFAQEFLTNSKSTGVQENQQAFHLARLGFEALFKLSDREEADYAQERSAHQSFVQTKSKAGMTIGVHIRRGDLHPLQPEFHNDYLPLSRYMDAVDQLTASSPQQHTHSLVQALTSVAKPIFHHKHDSEFLSSFSSSESPFKRVILATDDPTLYSHSELQPILRAQDRIQLADKQSLHRLSPHKSHWGVYGWEGGFYRDQFFSLGHGQANSKKPPPRFILKGKNVQSQEHELIGLDKSDSWKNNWHQQNADYPTLEPLLELERERRLMVGPEVMALRSLVGKAYILDLAVLGKTDAVVCAVSSAACRILGIMMGWDAVVDGRWKNVDVGYGWQGVSV